MTQTHLTDISFTDLPMSELLVRALDDLGFTRCTPIQAKALPLSLAGQDVLGQAQTGTGKTATFLLAAMDWMLKHPPSPRRKQNQVRALILAPTRELAIQIHKDAVSLAKYTGFTMEAIYGGTGYEKQRQSLTDGIDILIGTPGRTIDYFKQGVFDLKAAQVLVLDEADRMFDLGFITDIRYLLRRLPPHDKRLSMLFSATLPLRVTELAYEHMNNPRQITIEAEQVTARQIEEIVYYPANEEKIPLLLGLLKAHQPQRSIIFTNTKRAAERVTAYLVGNGYQAGLLSGDVPQNKRQRLIEDFQAGKFPILVATDVAARGLHIPEVTHIFNFDLPQDMEDYVHRIGRTARAGASGHAITLACEEYSFHLPEIEEFIGHKIPSAAISPELLATPLPPEKIARSKRPPQGGRKSGGERGKNPGQRNTGRGDRRPRKPGAPKAG